MLSIRLSRVGKRKQPLYRLIVTEKTRDPWGKHLEILGGYNPRTKAAQLNTERIQYWISKGALATPTVHNLLLKEGVTQGDKVRAGKTQPGKKRQAELDKIKADEEAAKAEAEKPAPVEEAPAEVATAEPEAPAEVAETAPEAAAPEAETAPEHAPSESASDEQK